MKGQTRNQAEIAALQGAIASEYTMMKHLYSSAHGCLESFTINVYDSVEKMYDALKKRLDRLAFQEDVVLLESRDSFHLIKDFH